MGKGRRRKRKGSVSTPLEVPSNFLAAVVPACEKTDIISAVICCVCLQTEGEAQSLADDEELDRLVSNS